MTGEEGGSAESLKNAEVLLDRLEAARAKLEATTDPEEAVEVLAELSEIAKEVEAEVARAKRQAELGETERADG